MMRFLKAGILLLLLVVPAFVFLFLKFFGQNHFFLPTYFPRVDAQTGEVQIQTRKASWWKESKDTVFYALPDIKGKLSDGKPFSTDALKGKLTVASFLGPTWDTTCTKVSGQLNRVQDVFSRQTEVMLLSYTDNSSVASYLLKNYEVEQNKWLIANVEPQTSAFVGEQLYRIKQRPLMGRKNETFTLYEGLVLVDKEGHIRGFYNGTDKVDIDRLILEIRVLLDIYAKQ